MKIHELRLKNFRNYSEEIFSFGDGINILCGQNAQGKTNAAEAVFLLCTGYSPRATKDKQLVKTGEERANISCLAQTLYGEISIDMAISPKLNKEVKINQTPIKKIGELLGNVNSVFFNPSELKLVQEAPEDRRRFLNISLSQMSRGYFYALGRYNKILYQRNNLLKEQNRAMILDTLPIWDKELVKYASKIVVMRNELLKALAPFAEEAHAYLSGGSEKLSVSMENGWQGSQEEVAYAIEEDLKLSYEKDLRLGFTNIGPHRDDMKIILNGEDVRIFGSQGQQRTVALSIKLAEAEIFKARTGEYPVLILDDVLSELDKTRQRRLISKVEGMQTILTCTNIDGSLLKGKNYKKIKISLGKIKNNLDKRA